LPVLHRQSVFALHSPLSTDTPPTATYTLSLHDALPISEPKSSDASTWRSTRMACRWSGSARMHTARRCGSRASRAISPARANGRSEEHTSELQSRENLVCRLLLEKKKKQTETTTRTTSN